MTVVRRGTTQVITPRDSASAAHTAATQAEAPKKRDGDTFEVTKAKASSTGPAGSLRRDVAVDSGASGAYFNKIVAPRSSENHGIRVEGRLPEVMLDPKRFSVSGSSEGVKGDPVATTKALLEGGSLDSAMGKLNDWRTGPSDKPSVYLGGNAGGAEADVGLSFDRVYDGKGNAVFTDLAGGSDLRKPEHQFTFDSQQRAMVDGNGAVVARGDDAVKAFMIDHKLQPSFAFRPYWRVSPSEKGTDNWTNPPVTAAKADAWAKHSNHTGTPPSNAYFYPGEHFAMAVKENGKGQMRLDIRGNGVDNGVPAFQVGFKASSFGQGAAAEWKRVSSIDQKGTEGKAVQPTSSMAIGMVWEKSEVLRGSSLTPTALSSLKPVQVRGNDLADSARYDAIFNVDVVDGKEIVTIRP